MKHAVLGIALSLACAGAMAADHQVRMLNTGKDGSMVFEPGFLRVAKGDTVKFVKVDPSHNSASVLVPAGAAPWKGKPDEEISVKLDQEGVYLYVCEPHKIKGMSGVFQVGKPLNLAEAKGQAETLSKSFVMNKDRLAGYMAQVK
jgi:pseudoazurin